MWVRSRAACTGALDLAGNRSASVGYNVVYDFAGFFQPVDNLPVFINSIKAGQAVPIKFSLHGNYGLSILAAGYPQVTPIACDTGTPLGSGTPSATPGPSQLSYAPAPTEYH